MKVADLESILKLRNHSEIRRHMLTRHEISSEEHASWFARSTQNPALELLVFELDLTCCGFVQFKQTSYPGVVDWGFYTAPDAPKGTGKMLGLLALSYAFKKKDLHKICGQALRCNLRSIGFHKSLGFSQEGILRDQHFDGTDYHDLICFGILRLDFLVKGQLKGIIDDHHR